MVHDFYRRFIRPDADERAYVNAGRICPVGLYLVAALLSQVLNSAQDAFEILISIGAGTGLLYLLRWFWWRINAWCEVVAMISSFTISVVFFVMKKAGHPLPFAETVIGSVAFTTICWLVTAFVSAPTSREQLIAFYTKVRPSGPGWGKVRRELEAAGSAPKQPGDHMGLATLGWLAGCLVIWSSLFAIGNFLYGRLNYAFGLAALFVVSGIVLLYVIRSLWDHEGGR
ncbi:MAG: hypothetical protein QM813_07435 [Verrucomicrobiota bacterium]